MSSFGETTWPRAWLNRRVFPFPLDFGGDPAMQETRVQSLGWEDSLEKGVATHASILAWRIPRTEEPGGVQSIGSQRVRHTEQLTVSLS